jgi:prolipoprotein diacylglyceryl transferase
MYPDLSYFIHDLTGLGPDNVFAIIKTFGLFLFLAFVASAYALKLEMKRKEGLGLLKARKEEVVISQPGTIRDVLISSLWGFFFGYKGLLAYQDFDRFRVDPAGIIFSSEGVFIGGVIGVVLLGGWAFYQYWQTKDRPLKKAKKTIHPHERVVDIAMVAAVAGIVGSKLFSILENLDTFVQDPIGEFFSGSGLTIYGGLILSFIAVPWYMKKKGLSIMQMLDAAAPSVILGYAVGRMGCHFSGDGDWGIVNTYDKPSWFILPDWMWAYDYPHNVLNEGQRIAGCTWEYCHRLVPAVFPTPIWEVLMAGTIFAILWALRSRVKYTGTLFSLYLVLNGIERFFIEFFRVNPRYDFMGYSLSQAQFIAIGFLVAGIATYFLFKKWHLDPTSNPIE